MNICIQRIDYSAPYDFLKSEILAGRLRQGWGPEGADLNGGVSKFIEAGRNAGWEDSESRLSRKYHNLCLMLKMKPGDIIIIPKLNMNTPLEDWATDGGAWEKTFTLLEVTEGYRFEPVAVPVWEDTKEFGHIIGVKVLGSYSYYQNDLTGIISETFKKPYHWNSESLITSEVIISAVQQLIAHNDDAENDVLCVILSALKNSGEARLKDVVTQLFVSNGFSVKDADNLAFTLIPSYNLIGDIALAVSGKFSEIRVYTSAAEWQPDAVNILIDMDGKFSDEVIAEAAAKGITLLKLSGRDFADLLLKYRVILPE